MIENSNNTKIHSHEIKALKQELIFLFNFKRF